MSNQAAQPTPLKWKSAAAEATVEGEPRHSIECVRHFMVGGSMAKPGQEVQDVPEHMAKLLQRTGRAKLIAA
ncbi:hypothetical protein M8009_02410 [Halomonas sp. ATCH28]|uniref:Uncharacterized protein n=1 Tax=Halomonas gemina TaxID=2945105 RepID=A0ABT0SWX9_9GAMM|nr:hypothetical protein [Halomonas gemina]MCL7939159.1 hypothetical protein [Halomonas gemina]